MDLTTIAQAIQSAKTGYLIARGLMNADSAYSQAELKLRVAELAGTLMDAQGALQAAQEEIQELRAEVARLESVNAPDQKPIKRGNKYFIPGASGEEGPYCMRCYEVEKRLMPLSEMPAGLDDFGKHRCSKCHTFA
jgi:hypothetical protein